MTRAGHSDYKTTQGYLHLAGQTFRSEAEKLERRLFGVQYQKQYQDAASPASETAENAA
ncbi:MAG TPA: hypothetical protein VFU51_00870 [Gaiellaceae bacterium]|nr:hypothetical protein [Gaiellaceae bacterium]